MTRSLAPVDRDVDPAIVPALAALALCRSSVQAMTTYLEIPDHLLPSVTFHASQRSHILPTIVRDLIKVTGKHRMIDAIGFKLARNLFIRFNV